jgi:hypothetical protein
MQGTISKGKKVGTICNYFTIDCTLITLVEDM